MRLDRTAFRTFLAAEAGAAGLEYVIIAAGVGLVLCAALCVVQGVVVGEFEAVDKALKHRNSY
jgi:Flp pilus assembly pilin Flp